MDDEMKRSLKLLAGFCTASFLLGAFVMWAMLAVEVTVR